MTKPREYSLELVVKVINLNYNESNEILERSPSLMGYGKLLHYIKDAKAEGLEAGMQKDKREGQCEIARKLKARGTEASEIAEITGLAIEEIEKI